MIAAAEQAHRAHRLSQFDSGQAWARVVSTTADAVLRVGLLARGAGGAHVRDHAARRSRTIAFRRTSRPSSSSPATPATTSSCSRPSSRSTSCRSGARSASSRSTSARWWARRSPSSAWPSSRTPTTSARPRASCWPAGSRARARTCASTTRWPPTAPRAAGGATRRRQRARGPGRRRRGGARDRVARVPRARLGGRGQERLKSPVVVDGRNFLDREALVEAGYTYEGVGR